MRARRGIALLTVVLLSALMLITIVGVGYVVVQEKIMVTSEYGFKDALAVAEAGMAQATANVQNAPNPISDEIFTVEDIQAIAESGITDRTVKRKVFPAASSSVITIKVQKMTAGGIVNGTLPDGTVIQVVSMGEKYVNADAAAAAAWPNTPSETTLIGRRVLEATYRLMKYTVPNFAMFAGGQIDFKGNNSSVSGSDIFANGDINLQKKGPRLVSLPPPASKYTVYSAGTVSNNNGDVVQDSQDDTEPISFQPPTLERMKELAFEFRKGTGFYADTTAGFPSTKFLKSYLEVFLGSVPTDVGTMQASTFTGVQNLTTDLMKESGTWSYLPEPALTEAVALRSSVAGAFPNLMKATYYVEALNKNDKLGQLHAIGTIAVNPLQGELQITGTATIDSGQLLTPRWWTDTAHTGICMFIYGDLKGTGSGSDIATLQGQITVTGSFSGSGNFTIRGQLLVNQSMTLDGNFYLTFVKSSQSSIESSAQGFVLDGSTWNEGTLDTFTNFGIP